MSVTATSIPCPTTAPFRAPDTVRLAEQRILIRNVSWEIYDLLSDAISEGQPVYLAYDGRDVEIMTKGRIHESYKELLGKLVMVLANELRIRNRSLGETTWKRAAIARGLEAGQCYYFSAEKIAADIAALARKSDNITDYPDPDLAIEIDISPALVDRPAIYAALKVPELWRFEDESLVIEHLGADGSYSPSERSRFLPVRADEVYRWIAVEDSSDELLWEQRLREWARAELTQLSLSGRWHLSVRRRATAQRTLMVDFSPLWLSLWVATWATLSIVAFGVPTSFFLARAQFPGKPLVAGVLILPLVLPPTVLGYYLLQILGRQSLLGHWLEHALAITLVFHWSGAVVASAVTAFPLFLLPARAAFESIDPVLEDAARLLGRGELSVFLAVTVPLAWRGLAAGVVLAFARSLGDFGATLMVAGNNPGRTQTAALAIYDAVNLNDTHRAFWLTLTISLISIIALIFVQRTLPSRGAPR